MKALPAFFCLLPLFLAAALSAPLSSAAQGRRISQISIQGLEGADPMFAETFIKPRLRLQKGKIFSLKAARRDTKTLYSLGLFKDIQIFTKALPKRRAHVIFSLKEAPLAGKIEFEGAKALSEEDLKELHQLKEGAPLSIARLQAARRAIEAKYKEKGFLSARAEPQVKPFKDQAKDQEGRSLLAFKIDERERAKVKSIRFAGNRSFSARALKSGMMTKEEGFFSFLDSSGVFRPAYFERDIEWIKYFYRDRGYLSIQIEESLVSISPDGRSISVYITLSEGPRFKQGFAVFEGDKEVPKESASLSLGKKKFFSLGAMLKDIQQLEGLYKEKGYAFAKGRYQLALDPDQADTAHTKYHVIPGQKYKIGQVRAVGNHSTRDKVILRQFRLRSKEIYKKSLEDEGLALTRRLGFFENVSGRLLKRGKNIVDAEIQVKEREHTGEAQLAAGYNGGYGVFIRGSGKKSNFLGLAHSVSAQVTFSQFQEQFNFNYHNPYLFDSDWSWGLNVFNIGQDVLSGYDSFFFAEREERYLSYSQQSRGFSMSLGRQLTPWLSASLRYRLLWQILSSESFLFLRKIPFFRNRGGGSALSAQGRSSGKTVSFQDVFPLKEGEGLLSAMRGSFEYDRRNDRYYTTKGWLARASAEHAGLGGAFDHTKLDGELKFYHSLGWDFVLKNSLRLGAVFAGAKRENPPFTELFLLGGPESLRGFHPLTAGRRKFSKEAYNYAIEKKLPNPLALAWRPYGGTKMFFASMELERPLIKAAQLHMALFLDIGEADNKLSFDFFKGQKFADPAGLSSGAILAGGLRANTGAGLRWRSPFGLIRLDWGLPFFPRKFLGEERLQFQFSMGSSF